MPIRFTFASVNQIRPEPSIASALGRIFWVVHLNSEMNPVVALMYPSLFPASSVNQTTPFGATAVAVGRLFGVGVLMEPTVTMAWADVAVSATTPTAAPRDQSRHIPFLCILYLLAVSDTWVGSGGCRRASQKAARE